MISMRRRFIIWIFAGLGIAFLFVAGCASIDTQNVRLPAIKGRMELVSGVINASEINQPTTEVLTSGSVFLFSPVEFPGHKIKLGLEEITSPLGQNVALRQAGEGLLRDIKPGQARAFNVRYQTSFDSEQLAKDQFRHLSDDYFIVVEKNGKKTIEVTNWKFRFVMLFSSDRKAFRVLIDNIHYYHPSPDGDEELQQETEGKVPVLISFAYLYPDHDQHKMNQTNIVFDYLIKLNEGIHEGEPKYSNWIPLQDNADIAPYSVEIAVAEIRKNEEFFKKVTEWIKNVRNLF